MSTSMWAVLSILIPVALSSVSSFFFYKSKDKESDSPFECGMDPNQMIRTPFYMHFFYISVLFLIFDIELSISIPLLFFYLSEKIWNMFWTSFLSILMIGLILEVFMGTLEWKE